MKHAVAKPLSQELLKKVDSHWRAANYLSVGQIYLYGNPLLTKPLAREHIKPRLLGHWGTTPGLNFIYTHLNRIIKQNDLNMIYITGPGHGGPALVANLGGICPDPVKAQQHDQSRETWIIRPGYFRMCRHFGSLRSCGFAAIERRWEYIAGNISILLNVLAIV